MAVLASYAVFIGAGVVAYTFAMQRSRLFWHSVLPDRLVPLVLVALHGLCVAAMWIGHYRRVNSWDAVVAPRETAESFLHVPSAFTIGVLFAMFVVTGVATVAINSHSRAAASVPDAAMPMISNSVGDQANRNSMRPIKPAHITGSGGGGTMRRGGGMIPSRGVSVIAMMNSPSAIVVSRMP